MFTTTPRFSPCDDAVPMPATRSSPLGSTSATTAITLAVPMSRPTTRSLYSLAMGPSVPLLSCELSCDGHIARRDALELHRVAVGMAQVGVLQRPLVARGHL